MWCESLGESTGLVQVSTTDKFLKCFYFKILNFEEGSSQGVAHSICPDQLPINFKFTKKDNIHDFNMMCDGCQFQECLFKSQCETRLCFGLQTHFGKFCTEEK